MHPAQFRLPRTLAAFACAGLAMAQAAPDTTCWIAFVQQSAARQQAILDSLRTDLPQHPLLAALGRTAGEPPQRTPKVQKGKATAPRGGKVAAKVAPAPALPLPLRVEYRFGTGEIAANAARPHPFTGVGKAPAKPKAGRPGTPSTDPIALQHLLLGCVPDADQALAALLQRLDTDAGDDAFAAFLDAWRNGGESFYEALDRTAGGAEGVFFFDAMLDDFRMRFARDSASAAARSLDGAHAALHDAFLAYRQYRGFREAVAWSVVLPPDVPLPAHLRRYEASVAGLYSVRQQVTMVLAALDHDVDRLVEAIAAKAPPLPQPLWQQRYDPFAAWNEVFQGLMPKMLQTASSTDEHLARAEAVRRDLARRLREHAVARVQTDAVAKGRPQTGDRGRGP